VSVRSAARLAACCASLCAVAAALSASGPRFERTVEADGPGRVAVRLDREVYESARADLGDLRLFDERGQLVPFVIERGELERKHLVDVRPTIRNRAWLEDRSAVAILDFAGRTPRHRLRLELSGSNFRRRVAVAGSDDQASWKLIIDDAWVFAVPTRGPSQESTRYETIDLPENDFPFLRVTVHPGPDERARVAIVDARVPAEADPPLREEALVPRWNRVEDVKDGETWLVLDLGARYQPFHTIDLGVSDERFFREALVEARREGAGEQGRSRLDWAEIGRGAVYRLEHAGRQRECLRIRVSGRERVLRVRLRNRDDRPLAIRGVAVRVPIERLVFDAPPGSSFVLRYGARNLPAPAFDLTRTVGDVSAWAASAHEGRLGVERVALPSDAAPVPWTERHPTLLWGGLIAVVAALGALTYRAIRRG
jgi:hypothetical protein